MHSKLLAGLTILALSALGCGGGGGGGGGPTAPPPPAGPKTVTVAIVDNAYQPQSVTIEPGDTVRWVLRGSNSGHTVSDRTGAFDSGFVFHADGDSFEHTFTSADAGRTFEYSCTTHKVCCLMQGSVRVGQNAPPPSPGY
jgi:plastocyanin